MEDYFNSKKYIILLVIVCLLFTIMTIKVFEYMPKRLETQATEEYTPKVSENDTKQVDEENDDTTNTEDSVTDDDEDENTDDSDYDNNETNYNNNHKSGHIDFMSSSYPDIKNLEEIAAPKGTFEERIEAKN